jgi:hypothetical protein
MSFDRQALPEPESYFQNTGLILQGRSKWRTTTCHFHGGRTTLRVNIESGAWVCMSCGERGGDVLAYEMQTNGADPRSPQCFSSRSEPSRHCCIKHGLWDSTDIR